MSTVIRWTGLILGLASFALLSAGVRAQPATQPVEDAELVVLDFPPDGVEIKILADIVTRRLGIPIIYDETIDGKTVVIRVPLKVPESALLGILHSALRMKQLALVDAEQPGWKKIVPIQNLAAVAQAPAAGLVPQPGTPLTQVITLRNVDPNRVIEAIRPLLTQPGGNILPVQGQKMLVISDYPGIISRVEQIARLLDADGPPVESRFVQLREADAATVVSTVTQLLANRENFLFGNAAGSGVFLTADDRLNQVVILAPADRMKQVVDLVSGMDQPQTTTTKVYRLRAISPERIDRLMKDLLGTSAKRSYQASIDRDTQTIVVSAAPAVQERLTALISELDQAPAPEESPVRFYKLKNTKAVDVLATIQSLTGESDRAAIAREGEVLPAEPMDLGSSYRRGEATPQTPAERLTAAASPFRPLDQQPAGAASAPANLAAEESLEGDVADGVRRARDASVTADVNTNSIIVVAPPSVQRLYSELIRRLDERRPQVQIECTIVTLDTSDGFSLGVDTGFMGGIDSSSLITFSSFGVAVVDPATGALTPTRGRGGTFALLNPSVADIVIRALSSNSRSRLISAPQLLVNDNGKGQLKSVAQQPFAEIVDSNASQAITSFGGQAEAGTTILVEPHISKDDYLQLTYSVELSNFTSTQGQSSGLPPPSQSNSVSSTVTIPDGFTIVVGGLSTRNLTDTFDSVPFINQVPIVKYLFGAQSKTTTDRTLFVFIRPVILRDDKFADLMYLSDRAVGAAQLPGDLPASEPIPLR